MTRTILRGIACAAVFAVCASAQTSKSAEERTALEAVINAATADARIAAVENLIAKFADTEFKAWAYGVAGETAAGKRDTGKATFYYEQALKADPKAYNAMLMLAGMIAQTTKEFDLDKEEKLNKAENYVKEALALIPAAVKPNPNVPDAQWEAVKKDDTAMAHVDLGIVATVRKKFDVAITEYKAAIESAATPDPSHMVRLAGAYSDSGKPDDAIYVLDKVLATAELNPAIKQVAESEKSRAQKMKTAK